MTAIQICEHCEEKTAGRFCRNCSTADKRREMDTENRKIMNNPEWHSKCLTQADKV